MNYIELSVHRHVPYADRYMALVEGVRYRIEREPHRGWQAVSQAGTVVARGRTLRELDDALGAVAWSVSSRRTVEAYRHDA